MKYTVRSLMEKLNMPSTHSYGVIPGMREKGLTEDFKSLEELMLLDLGKIAITGTR